jgi:hypothetical protein
MGEGVGIDRYGVLKDSSLLPWLVIPVNRVPVNR